MCKRLRQEQQLLLKLQEAARCGDLQAVRDLASKAEAEGTLSETECNEHQHELML